MILKGSQRSGGKQLAAHLLKTADTDEMKAINLPFYKMKLKDLSRELYLEHGWKIPLCIIDQKDRNPLNFSRGEWQQARRVGLNPKEIKHTFQECWAITDSCNAFSQALYSEGFILARGDRRGFVAVDYRGETYAIARYTEVKTKEVLDRQEKDELIFKHIQTYPTTPAAQPAPAQ